jgi:hypothetical protein
MGCGASVSTKRAAITACKDAARRLTDAEFPTERHSQIVCFSHSWFDPWVELNRDGTLTNEQARKLLVDARLALERDFPKHKGEFTKLTATELPDSGRIVVGVVHVRRVERPPSPTALLEPTLVKDASGRERTLRMHVWR